MKEFKLFLVVLLLLFISCDNHGSYVDTVIPIQVKYDRLAEEWIKSESVFYWEIYSKKGKMIAVAKGDNGSDVNGKEYIVEINDYYLGNHPSRDYQYQINDLYFNLNN